MRTALDTHAAWAAHLAPMASAALASSPLDPSIAPDPSRAAEIASGFCDESGHRRRLDAPLIHHLLGAPADPPDPPAGVDTAAWWLVASPRPDPAAIESLLLARDSGPIIPPDPWVGVEIWTQTELAALHALTTLAVRLRGDPIGARLLARASSAAAWHVEHIQPDNATNHPWAAHLFIDRAVRTGDPMHRLHAETLVNICCVRLGRPDRFSALLLLDAARQLSGLAAMAPPPD